MSCWEKEKHWVEAEDPPPRQAWRWRHYILGLFFSRWFHYIKGQWIGPCVLKSWMKTFLLSARELKRGCWWVFQHENDLRQQRSSWRRNIEVKKWPHLFPDLSFIQNLQQELKLWVAKQQLRNLKDLEFYKEEWVKIAPEIFANLETN